MTLLERTVSLLKESKENTEIIARNTGLTYWWLVRLRTGTIKDPSVSRICRLYEYLSGNKLEF